MANDNTRTWDFVERFYPNYYSCELIAESNDLAVIVEDGYIGSENRKAEFSATTEKAKVALALVNEKIYQKAIDAFLEYQKKQVIKLAPLEQIPLSSQLSRITGDPYAHGFYTNENGIGLDAEAGSIIIHVKTGMRFLLPEKETKYFLLGKEAVEIYEKEGIDQLIDDVNDCGVTWHIAEAVENNFINIATEITKEDYLKLNEL